MSDLGGWRDNARTESENRQADSRYRAITEEEYDGIIDTLATFWDAAITATLAERSGCAECGGPLTDYGVCPECDPEDLRTDTHECQTGRDGRCWQCEREAGAL